MNTKICTKCEQKFYATTEFFHKRGGGKDGLHTQCKSCYNKKKRLSYENNKEQKRQRQRTYYQENKEKCLNSGRRWRLTEKGKKCSSQEYYRNKEKYQTRQKKYYKNNKSKFIARANERRSSQVSQTPEYANLSLIDKIYEHCPEGYHVDHMTPLSRGGLHHESNLCYLPAQVNHSKGAKSIEEFGVDFFNENVTYWQDIL